MEKVMKYFKDFFAGLMGIMMAVLPVTILWQVLTGTLVFEMDVIEHLGDLVAMFGNGGFVGLVTLVIIMSFFIKHFFINHCDSMVNCNWKLQLMTLPGAHIMT